MNKFNKLETGRSMVEMLGVLAIVGVLSVAGIAGYTTAMNQYRANEAINRTMALAVMLSSQRLVNPNATLNANDLGSAFTVGNDTDKIVLTLSNVDEKVRSRIQTMGLKNADISIEGEAITFTFNNDLSEVGENSGGNNTGTPGTSEGCTENKFKTDAPGAGGCGVFKCVGGVWEGYTICMGECLSGEGDNWDDVCKTSY